MGVRTTWKLSTMIFSLFSHSISLSPEGFVLCGAVVFTALVGWIAFALFLVDANKAKVLPGFAKPLKPILGYVLAKPPKTPKVRVVEGHDKISLSWTCPSSSVWNDDYYEVQTGATDERVQKQIGSEFLRSYFGKSGAYTVSNLAQGHGLKFRVRCVNQSGKGSWSPVLFAKTTHVPEDCGGREEGYLWNQTKETVDITIDVPRTATNRSIRIDVKPRSIFCSCEDEVLLEGDLFQAVKATGVVAYTWELESLEDGSKVLKIELEKMIKPQKRKELWPKLLEGGLEFDLQLMKWRSEWDDDYVHVLRSEAMMRERGRQNYAQQPDPSKWSLNSFIT